MAVPFAFAHRLDFSPENSDALLRSVPAAPGVFSLRGPDLPDGKPGEPYLTRAADLRRRLRRLLSPPEAVDESGNPVLSKRLNLRDRVRFIDYTLTGSEFESTLLLYHASRAAFGAEEARKRLRLHTPYFLRVTLSHEHPRVYATNRLSKKSLAESFGPFPSRAAAERYCDAVLDLFKLRRCYEDLAPHPDHPGCVYGEMNKCLMPCKATAVEGGPANPIACTPADYATESARVFAFFRTRGQSLLDEVAAQRDAASTELDFEAAAALHKLWEKVRVASLLADELVRPIAELRAIILQKSAPPDEAGTASSSSELSSVRVGLQNLSHDSAAVFLLANGRLHGPLPLSTLGVRAVREQTTVGSSLFAQPLMLAAVPLDDSASLNNSTISTEGPTDRSRESAVLALAPEDRARALITQLESLAATPAPLDELCDAASLFRRWYYRPEKQRTGEVFLPNAASALLEAAGNWPIRRILNGAARIVLGTPTTAAPVDRDAAREITKKTRKTKVLHAGRPDVERTVPVLPRRPDTANEGPDDNRV